MQFDVHPDGVTAVNLKAKLPWFVQVLVHGSTLDVVTSSTMTALVRPVIEQSAGYTTGPAGSLSPVVYVRTSWPQGVPWVPDGVQVTQLVEDWCHQQCRSAIVHKPAPGVPLTSPAAYGT